MKLLAMVLFYSYGVICKHCQAKVIEPDKTKGQKYLSDRCPTCRKDGSDPVEKIKKEKLDAK